MRCGLPDVRNPETWLYVTPGMAALLGRQISAQAEVKIPVYRSLANKQLDSRAIFQVGISRAF